MKLYHSTASSPIVDPISAKVPVMVSHYDGDIMLDLANGPDGLTLTLTAAEAIALIGKLSQALQQDGVNREGGRR